MLNTGNKRLPWEIDCRKLPVGLTVDWAIKTHYTHQVETTMMDMSRDGDSVSGLLFSILSRPVKSRESRGLGRDESSTAKSGCGIAQKPCICLFGSLLDDEYEVDRLKAVDDSHFGAFLRFGEHDLRR